MIHPLPIRPRYVGRVSPGCAERKHPCHQRLEPWALQCSLFLLNATNPPGQTTQQMRIYGLPLVSLDSAVWNCHWKSLDKAAMKQTAEERGCPLDCFCLFLWSIQCIILLIITVLSSECSLCRLRYSGFVRSSFPFSVPVDSKATILDTWPSIDHGWHVDHDLVCIGPWRVIKTMPETFTMIDYDHYAARSSCRFHARAQKRTNMGT